ncbi:MAG: hypothetical protein BGN92_06880 [Sphingobacteriales bacterium 41-5]|nr:MAG: hypothetical protein BGN92_06880 [Sphingobacteriales bacterium 41-5]
MKKSLLAIGLCVLLFACGSGGQSEKFASATEYDDFITSHITQMQQSLFAVQNAKVDSTEIESTIKKYENQIDSVNKKIKGMPEFDGNKTYRNAASNLGEFYKKSVGTYYADIAKIYSEVKDTTADAKVQEVVTKLQQEEAKADDEFLKEREAFATAHKLDLSNTE